MELTKELTDEIKDFLLSSIKEDDNPKYHDLDLYYEDDNMAKDVIVGKYFAPTEKAPIDMWLREAWAAAQVESDENKLNYAIQYLKILLDYKFVPGGRINHGLGRYDINVSFSNCYMNPIKEDSLEAIYDCIKESALTFKVGGGVGTDISILRPKDSPIKGSGGKSCGATGFMELLSVNTDTVSQQNRRGASMISILCSHPDIEDFINIKNDLQNEIETLKSLMKTYPEHSSSFKMIAKALDKKRAVSHANISIKALDNFMKAVERDEIYDLSWGMQVYDKVSAQELWKKIIHNAWASAEPGIIFWDRMVENNNLEYISPLLSTNPCSEIGLGAYGNCLLGHINLSKFVINENGNVVFDNEGFKNAIKIAMRFLDNVITLNDGRHALPQQNKTAMGERRTGLGVTGLGDLLILLGLKYGSKDSLDFVDTIMATFRDTAYETSCYIAKERGAFPWFDYNGFMRSKFAQNLPNHIKAMIKEFGIRNGMLLTCAPVGTGSIIAQSSSGIEPLYRILFMRKIKNDVTGKFDEYKVLHPLIKKLFPNQESLPDYVVDSAQIAPIDRVKMQSVIQKYIDNSISSTVNLPRTATEEEVSEIYMMAWKLGCKGITVYREGSRDGILSSIDKEESLPEIKSIARNRPVMLQGETHKLKIDITGKKPYNSYVTVNFDPNTHKPYEILVTETNSSKEFKDIMAFETTMRLISLCLRYNVPIEDIVEQLEKVNCQYIYSLPISIANVLKNYINSNAEIDGIPGELCPNCNADTIVREGGCTSCSSCGYSKCTG